MTNKKLIENCKKTWTCEEFRIIQKTVIDVVLDYPINHKQLPMYKKKRRLPKILSEEGFNVFFDACDNYM